MEKKDSTTFIAYSENGKAMGLHNYIPHLALYRCNVLIFNDLFVSKQYRQKRVGEALLQHAKQFAKDIGSKGLTLETAMDNPAQKLYERLGWIKDTHVLHYTWER